LQPIRAPRPLSPTRQSDVKPLPVLELAILILTLPSAFCALSGCGGGNKAVTTITHQPANTSSAVVNAHSQRVLNPTHGRTTIAKPLSHQPTLTERRQLTTLVTEYYAAMAAADGTKACKLMNPTLEAAIPEDYGQDPGPRYSRGKTCPVVMAKVFVHTYHGASRADIVASSIVGFLLYAKEGLVQVSSGVNPHGEITVSRNRATGPWHIGTLIGSEETRR
jgi:hypothetical protein